MNVIDHEATANYLIAGQLGGITNDMVQERLEASGVSYGHADVTEILHRVGNHVTEVNKLRKWVDELTELNRREPELFLESLNQVIDHYAALLTAARAIIAAGHLFGPLADAIRALDSQNRRGDTR